MRTFSSGTPSSSAAICASAVTMPWPSSTLPTATVTVPSGSKRTRRLSRIEDRAHHAVVRAAAAEVAVQGRAHFLFAGSGILRKQCNCSDDDAAHAVAALRGLVPLQGLLDWMRA